MKKAIIAAMALLLGSCAFSAHKGEKMITGPGNKSILYSGRIDFSDPEAPRFDWPGINIGINFEGSSSCGVILRDEGRNDFNIIIDGKQAGVIETKAGEAEYSLASNLGKGPHAVLLTKRTETYDGVTVFNGFVLDKGAKLLPSPEKPKKKIEFIGDSLTVGFGVEGLSVKCDSERKYKNNYLSFAAVAARSLKAEYQIIAISGRGVVRNYGEKTELSPEPLPLYYDRTLMNDAKVKWDFRSWVPGIVVINLGTNDFSTEPKPPVDVFIKAYVKLIEQVRTNYPSADIFICVGPTQSEPFFESMKQVFAGVKDKHVHKVEMTPLKDGDHACDYHPNIKAAERMAGELVGEIKKIGF
jgi:lysophospholipase L1-like esterase